MLSLLVKLEKLFNLLELGVVLFVLGMAFVFQAYFNELPCPLCLLQRIGIIGIALGFLMNLRFGLRPSHYAIAIFSAVFTSFVSLRQIALHVIPGTGSYGSTIFGFHMYTWSFIICMGLTVFTLIMMSIDRQYTYEIRASFIRRHIINLFFLILLCLVVGNISTVLHICGWAACPDNPMITL